eukprot:1288724-Pyramimonas_sp.AAC.1
MAVGWGEGGTGRLSTLISSHVPCCSHLLPIGVVDPTCICCFNRLWGRHRRQRFPQIASTALLNYARLSLGANVDDPARTATAAAATTLATTIMLTETAVAIWLAWRVGQGRDVVEAAGAWHREGDQR